MHVLHTHSDQQKGHLHCLSMQDRNELHQENSGKSPFRTLSSLHNGMCEALQISLQLCFLLPNTSISLLGQTINYAATLHLQITAIIRSSNQWPQSNFRVPASTEIIARRGLYNQTTNTLNPALITCLAYPASQSSNMRF